MARLPGYLKMEGMRVEGQQLVCSLRIRWWHPGAWLLLLRALLGR